MIKCPICNGDWGWHKGQLITKENCPMCHGVGFIKDSSKNNNSSGNIAIIIMIIVILLLLKTL